MKKLEKIIKEAIAEVINEDAAKIKAVIVLPIIGFKNLKSFFSLFFIVLFFNYLFT